MSETPRLNKLLDENSEAGMLPTDRYSAVIAFAAGIERELTAEQKRYDELRAILARETARGDRLEKALREAIIALDEVGVIDPNFDRVENAIVFARAALGDTNG